MKTLTIRWQRLVNEKRDTCERCEATGDSIQSAFNKLKRSLAEIDIQIRLEKEAIDFSTFTKDPLQSNRIWIGVKPFEDWIGAAVGKSQCSDECEGSECRTLIVDKKSYEKLPENLIIRAGLLAAAEIL